MPSTIIRAFDYDSRRNELTVRFATGRVYVYSLVPAAVVDELRAAFSKGAFFNREIRNKYPGREIAAVATPT
jgi:hypothetical protein